MLRKSFITSILLLVLTACGQEETVQFQTKDHSIVIESPRVRIANKGGNSALYLDMKMVGSGVKIDRLISAMTPVCGIVELHNTITENIDGVNVKKMRPVQAIKIEKEKTTSLRPGGMHIMLINLKRDLHIGDEIPVTLFFENAGKVIIQAEVKNINGGCSNRKAIRPI